MKRILSIFCILFCLVGCAKTNPGPQVITTTLCVYEFTTALCNGTDIDVKQLITETVSCVHDYTLQVSQMRDVENASLVVISGGGIEDFLDDVLSDSSNVVDASKDIELICINDDHEHSNGHTHDVDPHYWLSPELAVNMVSNICDGLKETYPHYADTFYKNRLELEGRLYELQSYAENSLQNLSSQNIITFHDGFSYFATAFDLNILKAVEEEAGAEVSAAELIEIIKLVEQNNIQAIFVEENGSKSAASIIAAETGVDIYCLDMAITGNSYFSAMYRNIDTIKEALG